MSLKGGSCVTGSIAKTSSPTVITSCSRVSEQVFSFVIWPNIFGV